jgi:SNF2 family DNA or RNA helicase
LCKCIIDSIKLNNITKYKVDKIEEILNTIDKTNDKILIFSDFSGSFKIVSKILDSNGIKYTELNGGNITDIDNAIHKYKQLDTSILMIDSASQGCGMNLEMTTCIIFLHKTSELLYNQIIGRAQRYGRTNRLKVITLLNEKEKTN